jgi:uncharacterized membrane protein YGL010W
MRSVQSWLTEYGESHQSPVNKLIHWICIPLIMISFVGLLWSVPEPVGWVRVSVLLNWGVLFLVLALVYYYVLNWRLAIGMSIVGIVTVAIVYGAGQLTSSVWELAAPIFILAWTGQFVGHRIEGRKPSFFRDLQFLLIGPLWLLAALYQRRGLFY